MDQSAGLFFDAISRERTAVFTRPNDKAASASNLCAVVLLGSELRICSQVAKASFGSVRAWTCALASSGEALAVPKTFLKNPPEPPCPNLANWTDRSASRPG